MLNPQLKITIKTLILKTLFAKEEAAIQSKIDEILDKLTILQTGHFYRYKFKEYGRANITLQMMPVQLTEDTLPMADELHNWYLQKAAMHVAISNYIIIALNVCSNVAECKLVFPSCIQDILIKIPASRVANTEESNHNLIVFKADHKKEEQLMREQYIKNMVL